MGMARIGGDSGRPHRPAFIRVGHRAVQIDLNALYPQTPHHSGTYHPDGLQVRKIVTGVLTEWALSEWGEWYGKVTYTLTARDRQESVTHWVPGWALRPTDVHPTDGSRRSTDGSRRSTDGSRRYTDGRRRYTDGRPDDPQSRSPQR